MTPYTSRTMRIRNMAAIHSLDISGDAEDALKRHRLGRAQ